MFIMFHWLVGCSCSCPAAQLVAGPSYFNINKNFSLATPCSMLEGLDTNYVSGAYKSSSNVILGDVLIVTTMAMWAMRFVYVEKVVTKYEVPPILAVGWDGVLGFLTLSLLLIPMYYIPVGVEFGQNPRHVLEDALDGFHQLAHNNLLIVAYCSVSFSVSLFNWSVFTLTKERVFGLLKLSPSHPISCIFLCLH